MCAHSHRGTNCDREMLGWLLCRGCLRLFAIWNKRSSESQGENCGWRDNKAGVLAIWLTAMWPRNVKKFWTHVESEDTIVCELEGHEIVNTGTDTYSEISFRATNRLHQQCCNLMLASEQIALPAVSYSSSCLICEPSRSHLTCEWDRQVHPAWNSNHSFFTSAFQPISQLIHLACQVCVLSNPLKHAFGLHCTTSCLSGCFTNLYSNCDRNVLCDRSCWLCIRASNWLPWPPVGTHGSVG